MITFKLANNSYKYEMENVIRLFYPEERIIEAEDSADIVLSVFDVDNKYKVECSAFGETLEDITDAEFDCERALAVLLYKLLSKRSGVYPLWGIQTGVRPVKLYRSHLEKDGEAQAEDFFLNKMLVSRQKLNLAKEISDIQADMLSRQLKKGFSLYISIPFCPSRCNYCSFISHDVSAMQKLIPDYIEMLIRELKETARIAKDLGLILQSVYIGGGTPTAISAHELRCVMEAVERYFDTENVLEYTVEAGRPDTVTKEKLEVIKNCGATRISINPQTLSDEVLENIGRRHTAKQFYEAFDLARKVGFDNINTDLIAGLQGDTLSSFENTLKGICDLSPECITIHTLSIKRSSNLVMEGSACYNPKSDLVSNMLSLAEGKLREGEYHPYYLYRQSRMAGNHENIGWSKKGSEGLYNVFIMEEKQTILAVGAGASTKLVCGEHIERIFNYKYPYEYIRNFDEMIVRKQGVCKFYNEFFK